MCKLKVNDILVVRFSNWELKENKQYKLDQIIKDRRGNMLYIFKLNRKNAASKIVCYADDIDREISSHSYENVMKNKLYLAFERHSFYKREAV